MLNCPFQQNKDAMDVVFVYMVCCLYAMVCCLYATPEQVVSTQITWSPHKLYIISLAVFTTEKKGENMKLTQAQNKSSALITE